jgi:hypothetical protein
MNSPDEISTPGSQWYFLLHDAVVFEGTTSLKMFFRVTIQLTVFPAYGEKTKDEKILVDSVPFISRMIC